MLDLHFNFSDLDDFVDLLKTPSLWNTVSFPTAMNDGFYDACDKYLLSGINRLKASRSFTVRLFYSHIQQCLSAPVKVKLYPFRSGFGYMLDRGEVHILADLLYKTSHLEFVSVVLHETAHVVLSQWDGYNRLLQLDGLFAETYLKGQQAGLLKTVTPVEFFAQLLANEWLRNAAERTNDASRKAAFIAQIDGMHRKLLSAVDMLIEI